MDEESAIYSKPREMNSVLVMMLEATNQGWFKNLSYSPSIAYVCYKSAKDMMEIIDSVESKYQATTVYHASKYLFAKGVEAAIQCGPDLDYSKVQLEIDTRLGNFMHLNTSLPPHLHTLAEDSRSVGESLYFAHQKFILENQTKGINIREEVDFTLRYMALLGFTYGIEKEYYTLNTEGI